MRINKMKFITPLYNGITYKLVKNYSHTIILNNQDEINVASNVGPRPKQEDVVAAGERLGYIFLLVADGVGGEIRGNEASYVTAKIIYRWFNGLNKQKLDELDEIKLKMYLTKVINEMKDTVFPRIGGTTLNMSIVGPEKTFIVNIGDSRTYSIKDDEITLRTIDDSLSFQKNNPKTKEERDMLRYYLMNNIITNCIEMRSLTKVNVYSINNKDYDVLLHITDGISDILKEDEIKKYSLYEKPAETLVVKAVTSKAEYDSPKKSDFSDYIEPHDNASAVIYTKKRTKNN